MQLAKKKKQKQKAKPKNEAATVTKKDNNLLYCPYTTLHCHLQPALSVLHGSSVIQHTCFSYIVHNNFQGYQKLWHMCFC